MERKVCLFPTTGKVVMIFIAYLWTQNHCMCTFLGQVGMCAFELIEFMSVGT